MGHDLTMHVLTVALLCPPFPPSMCTLEGDACLVPIATRLHSLRRLDINRTHSLSAAMLEALLESSVQGCSLRVGLQPGQHKGLSAEVCESTWAAVAGRRGRRLTPMLSFVPCDW